jgi:hypothetical protein
MITIADYFMGRREKYPAALTTEIERNAARTVDLANKLLTEAQTYGVTVDQHPVNRSPVSSGWRPPEVNAATPNAAARSKHMTGQAIDIYDPDGDLDEWLMTGPGQAVLSALGLWMEHPSATKGWCHVQTVPPGSGRRVFYP